MKHKGKKSNCRNLHTREQGACLGTQMTGKLDRCENCGIRKACCLLFCAEKAKWEVGSSSQLDLAMSTRTPSAGALEVAAPAMSRIRASRVGLVSPNKRPSTPRFLAPSLAAAPSFKPLGRVLPPLTGALGAAGPSKLRESRSLTTATTGEPSRGSKRAAVDCIDLTATTEPDARSSAQKRIRVGTSTARPTAATTTAAHDARAKTKAAAKKDKDKARAEQNDKMTAESITWRMKYKKAFPSFVFYFDALDPATELSLIKSVEYLGAVSPISQPLISLHFLNLALSTLDGRQLLLEKGDPRHHLSRRSSSCHRERKPPILKFSPSSAQLS